MDQEKTHSLKKSFTRRQVIGGAAAIALGASAAAGASAVLSGCGNDASDEKKVETIAVDANSVVTLDAYTEEKDSESLYKTKEIATISDSAIISSSDGAIAAVMRPGSKAKIVNSLDLMDLSSGKSNTVLPEAQRQGEDFNIYEARVSSEVLAWVESNYLTGDWSVFSASVAGTGIGSATKLDEGNSDYDAPELAVVGANVYWVVQPAEGGSKTSEESYLKMCPSGSNKATEIITSSGRFCSGLSVNGKTLCAMPRTKARGSVQYQMSAVQGNSVVSELALPSNFKPNFATAFNGGFSLGVPASYNYGGGIANVGTYCPLGSGKYLRFIRQPVTPPGIIDGWIFSKSGARTVLVDVASKSYFTIDPPKDSADYGDYSIQFGEVPALINFATIINTAADGTQSKYVSVRRISLTRSASLANS